MESLQTLAQPRRHFIINSPWLLSNIISHETTFSQDFNGDGVIGGFIVESSGTTLIVNDQGEYVASGFDSNTNPLLATTITSNLTYGGSAIGPNSYSKWSVVGAEITNSTEVKAVWKSTSGQFWVSTNTDQGNSVTDITPYESEFQQDLNGDGSIIIESAGNSSLSVSNTGQYVVNTGGIITNATYLGSPITTSTRSGWKVIGAEVGVESKAMIQIVDGSYLYLNYNTNAATSVEKVAIVVYENEFQQDFNKDGIIAGANPTIVLNGTPNNDTLIGTVYNDSISGGDGDDYISGLFSGNDTMYGGLGNDTIWGGNGNSFIDGGAGNDEIRGFGSNNSLYGGDGDDLLSGGSYQDGGAGNDRLFGVSAEIETFNGGDGIDSVGYADGSVGDYDLIVNLLNPNLNTRNAAGDVYISIENVEGDLFAHNHLTGDNNSNYLKGGIYADTLDGGAGDDRLNGLGDLNLLHGGSGNDSFEVDFGGILGIDTIDDFASGVDKIVLTSSSLLGSSSVNSSNFVTVATDAALAGPFVAGSSVPTIIYSVGSGNLFFDQDGTANAGVGIQFATLSNKPAALSVGDFILSPSAAPV
jgi:Ca2+-binding RTX toxin-like protein